jgi:hypothetical protein
MNIMPLQGNPQLQTIGLTCSQLSMVPDDDTKAVTNFTSLCAAINNGYRIFVDGKYYIQGGVSPGTSITNDILLQAVTGDAEIVFVNTTNKNNSYYCFDLQSTVKQIILKGIKFSQDAAQIGTTYIFNVSGANKIALKLNKFIVNEECKFSGYLRLLTWFITGYYDVDPTVTDFGIRFFCFNNNDCADLRQRNNGFIVIPNIPIFHAEILDNQVNNFVYIFFSNEIVYSAGDPYPNSVLYPIKFSNAKRYLKIADNTVINDVDWDGAPDTDAGVYHCFAFFEGLNVDYINNHIEGLHTENPHPTNTIPVYDAYFSCDNLNVHGNTWKNNLNLISNKVNAQLMKSKGSSSGNVLHRIYKNNTYIVEKTYADNFTGISTIYLSSVVAGNTITINDTVFTAVAEGATGNQFNVDVTDAGTATNLATKISAAGLGITATASSTQVRMSAAVKITASTNSPSTLTFNGYDLTWVEMQDYNDEITTLVVEDNTIDVHILEMDYSQPIRQYFFNKNTIHAYKTHWGVYNTLVPVIQLSDYTVRANHVVKDNTVIFETTDPATDNDHLLFAYGTGILSGDIVVEDNYIKWPGLRDILHGYNATPATAAILDKVKVKRNTIISEDSGSNSSGLMYLGTQLMIRELEFDNDIELPTTGHNTWLSQRGGIESYDFRLRLKQYKYSGYILGLANYEYFELLTAGITYYYAVNLKCYHLDGEEELTFYVKHYWDEASTANTVEFTDDTDATITQVLNGDGTNNNKTVKLTRPAEEPTDLVITFKNSGNDRGFYLTNSIGATDLCTYELTVKQHKVG